MYQAINTKYFGPTNTRGSKIIATSASGHRHTMACAYENHEHIRAAQALAEKLGWQGRWAGGATKEGYCFVCIAEGAANGFFVTPESATAA